MYTLMNAVPGKITLFMSGYTLNLNAVPGEIKRIHGACFVGSSFHDESPVIPGELKTSTE